MFESRSRTICGIAVRVVGKNCHLSIKLVLILDLAMVSTVNHASKVVLLVICCSNVNVGNKYSLVAVARVHVKQGLELL